MWPVRVAASISVAVRGMCCVLAVVVLTQVLVVFPVGVSTVAVAQASMATVSFGDFEASCAAEMVEGSTYSCTLANTSSESQEWPSVGLLHSSDDDSRALVAGSPLDVEFGAGTTATTSNWWFGSRLIGYVSFDLPGTASAMQSRQFVVEVIDDELHEPAETFHLGMIASGSKNISAMYLNSAPIVVAASDSAGSDGSLKDIELTSGAREIELTLSAGVFSYDVSVGYEVAELVVAPVPSDDGATVSVNGVELVRPDVGKAGVALSVPAGATAVSIAVAPADGSSATTYTLNVTRRGNADGSAMQVEADGFNLSCPYKIYEGLQHACTLTNENSAAANWPVVAVVHSSLDADRALVAGDSVIGDTDSSYSKDVRFWAESSDSEDVRNYGYGELFPGELAANRVVYGYQKVDLAGEAAAGERLRIRLSAEPNDDESAPEVFYVAMAADGVSSLSGLVDNRVPVLVAEATDEIPAVGSVEVGDFVGRSALMSIAVDRLGPGELGVFARWRLDDSTATWTTGSTRAVDGAASLEIRGLVPTSDYQVEASVDQAFPEARTTEYSFTTPEADQTLLALSVVARGRPLDLTPEFTRRTTEYSATVEIKVVQVTVSAQPADELASVTWLDDNDNELEDNDSIIDGFQVRLRAVGTQRLIKARVSQDGVSATMTYTVAVTLDPPELVSASVDEASVRLVYDEDLNNGSTPGGSDFSVSVTDSVTSQPSSRSVIGVSVSGRVVALTLAAAVRYGDTVTVGYTKGANPIQDLIGNDAANLTGWPVDNITPISRDTTLGALSLSGVALVPGFAPGTVSYMASVANDVTQTTVSAAAADSRASVSFTADSPGEMSFTAQHGLEVGPNTIRAFVTAENGSRRVYQVAVDRDVERVPPELVSASVDGLSVRLVYDEDLDNGSTPGGSDFSVSVTDSVTSQPSARSVIGVSVNGRVVALTLGAAVRYGDTVTVGYTKGANPIQDLIGNDAADLAGRSAGNNTPRAGDTALRALLLSGVALVPGFAPGRTGYTAEVANEVTQTTVSATAADSRASVSFTAQHGLEVGPNTIRVAVTAENGMMRVYQVAVDRDVERVPPELVSASVDGLSVRLVYDEDLDNGSTPGGSDFSVSVTDSVTSQPSARSVIGVSVNGRVVALTLGAAVRYGDTVTVGYTKGANPIQDLIGNDAADLAGRSASNNTPRAGDTALRALLLSGVALVPGFAPGRTGYTAEVANEVTQTTVSATAADSRAVMSFTAQHGLEVGPNTIRVAVTAENGSRRVYQVAVTRLPETTEPTLLSASVDGLSVRLVYDEDLDNGSTPGGSDFSVSVTDSVTSQPSARSVIGVSVNGRVVALTLGAAVRYGDTVTVGYTKGANPIQDLIGNDAADLAGRSAGNNTAISGDATLISLSLSGVTLVPGFAPGRTGYTAEVANEVTQTTVSATAADSRASVSFTAQHGLEVGPNTIRVAVTAENGMMRRLSGRG